MDHKVKIRKATELDAQTIGLQARSADKLEIWASAKISAETAAVQSLRLSNGDCWVVYFNDELAFIFGVVQVYEKIGAPWAITTNFVTKCPILFTKTTKELLPLVFKDYNMLTNFVDNRYVSAKRWLKLLGFHIGPPVEHGEQGEYFCPFIMRRKELCVKL